MIADENLTPDVDAPASSDVPTAVILVSSNVPVHDLIKSALGIFDANGGVVAQHRVPASSYRNVTPISKEDPVIESRLGATVTPAVVKATLLDKKPSLSAQFQLLYWF